MKHKTFAVIMGAFLLLSMAGCSKQKTCRCSVLGSQNVRIIKIEHGECDQIRLLRYHDMYDSLKVDSLLCTDYEFAIDSIFND